MKNEMNTKQRGGTFRSEVSLSDAQEHLYREAAGLPRHRTLSLEGENAEGYSFDKARSLAELDAIMGGRS